MTSKPRHLHIAALIFFLVDSFRGVIFPFAIAVIGVANIKSGIWTIGVIVAFVVFMIVDTTLRYFLFTYQILSDEIVVKSGIFVKKVNHVPFERIQNITTNQWFFLKPLGLEELEIETAGHSEKPEVQLKAVPDSLRDEINALRQKSPVKTESKIDDHESGDETITDFKADTTNSYTISWSDLLKFAFTSPAFLTGLLVVLAFYGKVSNAISKQMYQFVADEASHLGVLLVVGAILLVLLLFYIGSVIILIVQYYHFKLTESDGQFFMERGLLQTRKTSIAMDRVQAVMIKQPLLRSFLKIVTVQLVIVSNSKKGDSEKDIIVMPVIAQKDVNKFIQQFFPDVPTEGVKEFKPIQWTYYYHLRNAAIFFLITALIVVLPIRSIVWLWVTLVIIAAAFWFIPALYSIKRSKVQVLTEKFLVLRKNYVLTNQMFFLPKPSIQFIEKRESIWLEKKQVASLTVNIRSGANQKKLKVNYQSVKDIDEIVNWYKK